MNRRTTRVSGALALALIATTAHARAAIEYYSPPALVTRGTATISAAGAGTVVVQVLVDKSGSFKVVKVIRSSNSGDNAAALQIAKGSTYKPATRGSAKQTAYYDFTLRFASGGHAATTAPASGLAKYESDIRSGDYASAKTGLTAYVVAHPSDTKAFTDLGVADTFANDFQGAAVAFDKVPDVPSNYKALAAKAYAEDASVELKNKSTDRAIASAKRATQLAPGFYTYNTLGFAESEAGQTDAAIADLEHARQLGASDAAVKPKDRAVVDANLASVYLTAGKPDLAKTVVAEATTLDPSSSAPQNVMANYDVKAAQTAAAAGKTAAAAALYEQAATAAPSQASAFYAQAAIAYLNAKPNPDNASAKADADRALAADPSSALANYAAGIALANQAGKSKDALVYLTKADESAKSGNDAQLATLIETAIKQLNGTK